MKYNLQYLILIFFLCLLTGCSEDTLQTVTVSSLETEASYDSEKTDIQKESYTTLTVYICGEVYFPGVYTLSSESRICDVVKKAGGLTHDADCDKVNLARKVTDGEQIIIPSVLEKTAENESGLIDINSATKEMLCTIAGIGSTRAEQIIEYREKNGRFETIEDIMKVSGIKEGTFEKIAPYITVF